MAKKAKDNYKEGECESCGAYGRVYEVEGQLLCEECRDEEGQISDTEAETEED